jgi:pimeloyl-ACP methyl ester carboxylesterase
MLTHNTISYVFIRAVILCLRAITPLCIAYCFLWLTHPKFSHTPLFFDIIAATETAFYFGVYLPRRYVLQQPESQPTAIPQGDRRQLFHQCWATVYDPRRFVSLWFKGAPIEALKREDVKDWLCWAFLNKRHGTAEDDRELEQYVAGTENKLEIRFQDGRGRFTALMPTIDKVKMQHRPLLYYIVSIFRRLCLPGHQTSCGCKHVMKTETDRRQLAVGGADTLCYISMMWYSFQFHRLALSRSFSSFPFRLLAPFSKHRSPAKHPSYWHRPHTSHTRLPVLFIHGIGIGLHTYLAFFHEFNRMSAVDAPRNGQTGLIALEIMPISFRITHTALDKTSQCAEIMMILKKHRWTKVVLVAHSYGTIIATHLLKDLGTSPMIAALLLIDPVTFSVHTPDIAYNFTWKAPRTADEHQLHYFACMDMGVAHTVTRRFFWTENILWKGDLVGGRKATVVLAGRDIIVDTKSLWRYLTTGGGDMLNKLKKANSEDCDDTDHQSNNERIKRHTCMEDGLREVDILCLADLNHAEVFDTRRDCGVLISVILNYCQHENL